MPGKLKSTTERQRHYHAFETYRDMGVGRSYRKVARMIGASPDSVGKWAKLFDWEGRMTRYTETVAAREATSPYPVVHDPVAKKFIKAMKQMEVVIDSAFAKDLTGEWALSPQFKLTSADDLIKIIEVYRKFIETYNRIATKFMPQQKAGDRATTIKEFNVNMGSVSQEERIQIMKGLIGGNVNGGDRPSARAVAEGDFRDIPGQRDEDGPGRDGVPGSPPDSDSGDKADM